MASDGPGKFKERKGRTTKPYDRPKGIIRRVTESVTGLFSASWLPGWMGGEEDEESNGDQHHQQPSSSQPTTLPPPGESFIFAQPVTSRRPFKPFYPEEGETDNSGQHQQHLGVNEGASTSRMSAPTAAAAAATPLGLAAVPPRSLQLSVGESASPVVTGRRLPVLSSTPTSMFVARTKGQMEPRSLPLIATSTPTADDGSSEVSESSIDTGVDASVIPRPDERDYQREILQLDEESLQTLRDSLAKTVPTSTVGQAQAASILPTLEETRKRPRDLEPDHSSIRAEGSVSSKSLFSELGDISHGQPQPSGLASKRPRFNVSMYGSPILDDKSVLSDSAFKASPFYPGKTMYGGASAYRSRRFQSRTPVPTSRVQVKPMGGSETSSDGGLSQAARRILESLEQMSTPISDAKRIPTPTLGQRGSFLDHLPGSYRAAAFHRHRTSLRQTAPPTASLLTPTKVPVQANLASSLLVSGEAGTFSSTSSLSRKHTTAYIDNNKTEEPASTTTTTTTTTQSSLDVREAEKEEARKSEEKPSVSIFSKAAAEATFKFTAPSQASLPSPQPSDVFKFGLADSSASQSAFQFVPKPATISPSSDAASSKKYSGKVKSKVVESTRSSNVRHKEEMVEDPQLPSIALTMPSLPKINLSMSTPSQVLPVKSTSSYEGFKFSTPEIVNTQSVSESLPNAPKFTFRSPALVGETGSENSGATTAVTSNMMFNCSSPTLAPKLKVNAAKTVPVSTEKLKEGSILDILKPKGNSPEKIPSLPNNHEDALKVPSKPFSASSNLSSMRSLPEPTVNNVSKEIDAPQGFQGFGSAFKKSSNEWECSVCMVRNKISADKCVACETSKPGLCSSSAVNVDSKIGGNSSGPMTVSGTGWGDAFKKSSSEWECDMCMLRNKDSSEKCVACETPKPGSKKVESSLQGSMSDKSEKTAIEFGTAFAKGKGEWECDTCLVRNKSDATKCISCETTKPGTANVCEAITGNFKFGVNTNKSSSTFNFGLSNSQAESQPASGGFNFGVSAKKVEENKKGDSGFSFGVPTEKSNALGGFSFGVSSVSSESKEKTETSSAGFTFGVQKTDDKSKDNTDKNSSIFTASKTSKTSGVGSADTNAAMFQFTPPNKSKVAFSFGSGSPGKAAAEESRTNVPNKIAPAVEFKSGSVVDALKKGKETETKTELPFGSKLENTKSKNPLFAVNSVVAPTSKENEKKVASPFTFSVSKTADSTSEAASQPTLSTKTYSEVKPTPPSSGFTFVDKGATGNAFPTFSFNATSNKEETKPNFTFNTSSKRENSDTNEPAKKMAFGTSSSTGGINNGVAAPTTSLFTFGSKENKLGTGAGFGAPSASTPAFGAPAPSSNTTPSFQFGNSNPPAPAATAPSPAFGNPAPAFGGAASAFGNTNTNNNNTNSSSGFAFGQSSDKKPSTGFDFGQATPNSTSPNPGFNFGAATQSSLFQFGQSPVTNASPASIFQFGSSGAEMQTPTTGFGAGENPFNTAHPPPSGRVVKKAVRRTRK